MWWRRVDRLFRSQGRGLLGLERLGDEVMGFFTFGIVVVTSEDCEAAWKMLAKYTFSPRCP